MSSPIALDGAFDITRTEVKQYGKDSKRCAADRKKRKGELIHATYLAMRNLKPEKLMHVLLGVGFTTLVAVHT